RNPYFFPQTGSHCSVTPQSVPSRHARHASETPAQNAGIESFASWEILSHASICAFRFSQEGTSFEASSPASDASAPASDASVEVAFVIGGAPPSVVVFTVGGSGVPPQPPPPPSRSTNPPTVSGSTGAAPRRTSTAKNDGAVAPLPLIP